MLHIDSDKYIIEGPLLDRRSNKFMRSPQSTNQLYRAQHGVQSEPHTRVRESIDTHTMAGKRQSTTQNMLYM